MLDQWVNLQTIVVFIFVFCITVAYLKARRPPNFPPGPPTLPFLGNVRLVSGNNTMHKTFSKLAKEYGPIFGLQLGWHPVVVISKYEILREALVDMGDIFSDWANRYAFAKLFDVNLGIINSDGDVWKGSKRLALSSLRDFGFGKASMEERIIHEAEILVTEIGKKSGKPFRFNLLLNKATSNIMNIMLFGERYEYENEEIFTILEHLNLFMKNSGLQLGEPLFLPYLLPLIVFQMHAHKNFKFYAHAHKFLQQKIKEHRQTFDPDNIRDFVDVYIEMEMKDSKSKVCQERNLTQCITDLLLAGSDTTSTTLAWAMLFLLKYPEVQDKCREEIFKVIGDDRKPRLKDRDALQYVDATLCEVLRLGNTAPHAVMHRTNREVKLCGYTLPEDTIVIPSLYDIHLDPEVWKDPKVFNPERFLKEDRKVVKPPQFQPFSLGKRACLGENLARTELFLFFTSLLQKYHFTCEDVAKLPDQDSGSMGIALYPEPYDIIATPV